jgi:hypothetical protein
MQIQGYSNNSFKAKLDINPVDGMINDEEIKFLKNKAKQVWSKNDKIKIFVGDKVKGWAEGDFKQGDILKGYNMEAVTLHQNELDKVDLSVKTSIFSEEEKPLDEDNKLKPNFRPFVKINEWLELLKKTIDFS